MNSAYNTYSIQGSPITKYFEHLLRIKRTSKQVALEIYKTKFTLSKTISTINNKHTLWMLNILLKNSIML